MSESHSCTFTELTGIRPQELQATTRTNCCVNRPYIDGETEVETSHTQNLTQKAQCGKICGVSKPQIIWYYVCIFVCACVCS